MLGKRGVENPGKDFCARRGLGRFALAPKKGDMMGAKLKDFVDALDFEELRKLKDDLERGGLALSTLVNAKIEEKHLEHGKFCATCLAELDPLKSKSFTLVFGPPDLRKRASFCAVDCMEYFLANIKNVRQEGR
ncbi:MAG: hypothetical protein ABIF10_06090 [Candidatus Woesearchaeota archaeon]